MRWQIDSNKILGHWCAMPNHTCNFQQNTLTSLFSVGLILSANLLLEGTTFPAISAVGSIKSRPGGSTKRPKKGPWRSLLQRCTALHATLQWQPSWALFSHDSVDLEVPSGGEESEGVNMALQVAPSGVAITEGATGYQLWPPWDLFLALVRYLCWYLPTLVTLIG